VTFGNKANGSGVAGNTTNGVSDAVDVGAANTTNGGVGSDVASFSFVPKTNS
jgi:hypothetical protein